MPLRSLESLETKMPITTRSSGSRALGEASYYEGRRAIADLENSYRSGTAPALQQERPSEQRTPPHQQPGHKDVFDIALSDTAPARGAVAQRPSPTALTRSTPWKQPAPQVHTTNSQDSR